MTETLLQGDCMKLLPTIKNDSIDLILCDPPYGTVKGLEIDGWRNTNKTTWDNLLPTKPLFKEYERILKPQGTLILFSQEPYNNQLHKIYSILVNLRNHTNDQVAYVFE